jgi:hypothetical protein
VPYTFVCPACKRSIAVRFLRLNEKGTCPVCGKWIRVPKDATEINAEEAPELSKDVALSSQMSASRSREARYRVVGCRPPETA